MSDMIIDCTWTDEYGLADIELTEAEMAVVAECDSACESECESECDDG